jgi:PAS domain S-box-containing protein
LTKSRKTKAGLLEEVEALRARLEKLERGPRSKQDAGGPVPESLRETEATFRAIGELNPFGIWECDPEGRVLFLSQSWLDMTGKSLEESKKFGWMDLYAPGEGEKMLAAWRRTLRMGKRWEYEHHIIDKDGQDRWVLSRGFPLRDEQGRIRKWVGLNIDVTERKQAALALQELNETLDQRVAERTAELHQAQERLLVAKEAANLGIFDFDAPSGMIRWDRRVREIWGVGLDEPITYEVFISGIHPDDRAPTQVAVDRAFDPAGDGQYCAEYRVVNRKDGVTRWVAASAQTFFENGRAVRLVGTVEDITERKQTEEALRKSEERYRTLFESIDEGFNIIEVLFNAKGKVIDYRFLETNPAFVNLTGLRDAVGKRMRELKPGHEEHWFETYGRIALTGKPERFTNEAKQLGNRWYDVYAFRIGKPEERKVAVLFTDITQHKRAEQTLRESEAQFRNLSESLEETVRQKTDELVQAEHLADIGRMVATVAHEVRNPIQIIRTGVDTLRTTRHDENEKQEILEEVEYGAKMLEGTISELLQYARPLMLEFSFAPLRDVVDGALKLVSDKLKRISVHIELERGDVQIHVDFVKLKQVLANIMSNAADAMPGGGSLTILSKTVELGGEKFLQISIIDTGHGVDPDHLDDIFKPFFTTKIRGIGLGLALCRKIMDAHCGDISVKSKVGKGTTVDLMVPLF